MQPANSYTRRRYIKISQKSGCISANYNLIENDEDSLVIPYENNDNSGQFRFKQTKS